MSNHHLLADEVHKTFFDCEKYLLPSAARVEQPFESFWRAANDGYDPPDKTNRYALAEPEARQLYDFLVSVGWRVRRHVRRRLPPLRRFDGVETRRRALRMNEQSSDKANRWLKDHTPPGWTRRLVPLPSVRGCRACGRVDTTTKYKVGLVYLHRAPELLYAFATLCGPCFDDADVKAALVEKVFVDAPAR